MTKRTLAQLVSEVQGKSMTKGWKAISLWDSRKTRELLFQLFIQKYNSEENIGPINLTVDYGDGGFKALLYGVNLGAPSLSFHLADKDNPNRAELNMKMISGMIVSTTRVPGNIVFVSKIVKLLPIGGPMLTMEQTVTQGKVEQELGSVVIDMRNASKFKANFVAGELTQLHIGLIFEEYFKGLSPKYKFYQLGRFENWESGELTPEKFQIRLIRSEPNARSNDVGYGDGALVCYITTTGGEDGKAFIDDLKDPYLIPADEGGTKFTAATIVSSDLLFNKYFRKSATEAIGNGVVFKPYDGAYDLAVELTAIAGEKKKKWYDSLRDPEDSTRILDSFEFDVDMLFNKPGSPLVVNAQGTKIKYSLDQLYEVVLKYTVLPPNNPHLGYVDLAIKLEVDYDLRLDKETGKVSFVRGHSVESVEFKNMRAPGRMNDFYWWMLEGAADEIKSTFAGLFDEMPVPELDTFFLRNLLWPGHNGFQPAESRVTGDLMLFGDIDRRRTSTVLSPLDSTVEAGASLQYTLDPQPETVEWRIKDVDGKIPVPGVISAKGLYQAPVAESLPDGFVTVMVTASGTLNGQLFESSSLVSVINSAIVVSAMYDSCDVGETRSFTAQAVDEQPLVWTVLTPQWGSTLTTVQGEPGKRLYKAGTSNDPDIPFALDKIEIKKTTAGVTTYAYIYVLITVGTINIPLLISDASDPSTGRIQFELRGKGDVPIDPSLVTWKLLHGEGDFNDRTGEYEQPTSVTPGSFIIVSAIVPGLIDDFRAIMALPLPLSEYAELIGTVNSALAGD